MPIVPSKLEFEFGKLEIFLTMTWMLVFEFRSLSVQQSNILQQQEFTSRVPVSISNRIPDQFG